MQSSSTDYISGGYDDGNKAGIERGYLGISEQNPRFVEDDMNGFSSSEQVIVLLC